MFSFSTPWIAIAIFIVLYAATIPLAWKMLAALLARATAKENALRDPAFWVQFIGYRFVIFAPYGVLLLFGQNLPHVLRGFVVGWVILGFCLSFSRWLGASRIVPALWWIYGFVYDGLNHFYPYRKLIDDTFKRLNVRPGQQILDLGCGTGNLTVKLARVVGADIVAVDGSRSMLGRLRRKLNDEIWNGQVTVIRQDVLDFLKDQPDRTFDRVAMVNVVYAVEDRDRLWREVMRVLKPHGLVVATTSDRAGSKAIVNEHLEHDSRLKLLYPKLFIVGIIDMVISEFSKTSVFNFPTKRQLLKEVERAGGDYSHVVRCYGGPKEGVNIMFDVRHTS